MSEWKECTLGEVLNLRRGYDLPHSKMIEGIIPVAGSNGIIGTHNIATDIEPCITVGRSGTAGSTFFYDKAWAHNTTLYIDDFKGNDPKYLYYLLLSLPLKKMAGGSAVPSLNRNHIHPLKIRFPFSIELQRSIASILSSLDSKIENNRKICANLEAQAQALFKHWFIDFAPFKDGKFVESELGMIPEGWRVGTLGNIAYINPSRTLQKGSKATYLDMKNMPTIGPFPLSWDVKEYNGGMRFMNGDTIMARITPCLENGKVAYVNFLQNQEIAFGSTEYIIMSPKNNLFSEYLYFLCRNSSFINYATKNMNGSSGRQRVSGDTISNYDMIIAPKEIYKEVEPIFKDIMCHIKSLGQESILLSTLRDTLLPKLMSGEIKV